MATLRDPVKQLSANPKYDKLMNLDPGEDPLAGSEEATPEEQAYYDDLFADFVDELYTNQTKNAVKMMQTSPELYQGVSKAAFVLLSGVYTKFKDKERDAAQAALFGEGGMISTAVDELFKLAQMHRLPGSDDTNQYTAAQMDMMRRVGDYLEKNQDDAAVGEAQDLIIDIELANNPDAQVANTSRADILDLDAVQFQDEARQRGQAPAGEAAPMPTEGPAAPPPEAMQETTPQPGGLI